MFFTIRKGRGYWHPVGRSQSHVKHPTMYRLPPLPPIMIESSCQSWEPLSNMHYKIHCLSLSSSVIFLYFKCRYSDTSVVLLEYYLEYFFLGRLMSVCVLIYLQASLLCLASEWYNFSIVNNLFLNDILARYRIFELYFLSVFCQCCILSISRCC